MVFFRSLYWNLVSPMYIRMINVLKDLSIILFTDKTCFASHYYVDTPITNNEFKTIASWLSGNNPPLLLLRKHSPFHPYPWLGLKWTCLMSSLGQAYTHGFFRGHILRCPSFLKTNNFKDSRIRINVSQCFVTSPLDIAIFFPFFLLFFHSLSYFKWHLCIGKNLFRLNSSHNFKVS